MRCVCIHGHFYQPPRENPSLEAIELQDSLVKAFEENGWGAGADPGMQQYFDHLVHLAEGLHIRAPQPELQP